MRVLLHVRLHDCSFNILSVRLGHVAFRGRRLTHLGRLDGAGELLLAVVLASLALVRAARRLDNGAGSCALVTDLPRLVVSASDLLPRRGT